MTPIQPRARSLGGCVTCRTRHFKCDEARPVCGNCKTLDVECLGYQNRILFLLEGQKNVSETDHVKLRRPLFTGIVCPVRRDFENTALMQHWQQKHNDTS